MKPELLLYMFAVHGGHFHLFQRFRAYVDRLNILGPDFLKDYPGHEKVLKPIPPDKLADMISALGIFKSVQVVGFDDRDRLNQKSLIMTDESVSSELVRQHFPDAVVGYESVFLQWNKEKVFTLSAVNYDATISGELFDQQILDLAAWEAEQSSDWWRHVGAIVVRDSQILLAAHNEHLPTEHQPYLFIDPRVFTEPGKDSHICSAIHSEQRIVATAARRGLALEGSDLYVTTFPCPVCAKIVAETGFKRVFFREGHASLDGEMTLKDAGIEIIHVQ